MNINTFDLNLLRAFDAVMIERSVSVAGVRIGLSQSAISNALARMRNLCDDPLFVRTSHGMQPTPFAADLAEPVRIAIATLSAALEQHIRFDPLTSRRQFKIALSDIGAVIFLPTLMMRLNAEAPGVRCRVVQFSHEQLPNALENGLAEIAIGGQGRPGASFFQQRLFNDRAVCVMRCDHPLASRRLTVRAYSSASHVVLTTPPYARTVVSTLTRTKRPEANVKLELPHAIALPPILAKTDLIATVSETTARHIFAEGQFVSKPLPFPSTSIDVMQYWHSRYHRDAGVKWLRNLLAHHFSACATGLR